METKLIAMIVGVALVLATATVYTQSAFAFVSVGTGGAGPTGSGGTNGVAGGSSHPGHNACDNSGPAEHNPHCGQTPTGGSPSSESGSGSCNAIAACRN